MAYYSEGERDRRNDSISADFYQLCSGLFALENFPAVGHYAVGRWKLASKTAGHSNNATKQR